jgi:hypothetical protein
VALCSAPSVALGSVGPDLYRGSFHLDELALTGGELRLLSSARIMVTGKLRGPHRIGSGIAS